jgi:PKD repeat protein
MASRTPAESCTGPRATALGGATHAPRGQSLVELALVLPIFAFLVVIAVDFGRLYYSYIQITNAAREAAAYGAVTPTDTAGMEAVAFMERNTQGQRGETPVQVSQVCRDPAGATIACSAAMGGAGPGNTLTVTIAEEFNFITPLMNGFFGNDLTMRVSATSTVLGLASGSGSPPAPCAPPVPAFSVIVTSGLSIHVDPAGSMPNSGVCTISGYNWTWGDGEESVGTATGDDHTYAAPATFTIILETTNQGGSTSVSEMVTVPAGASPTCDEPSPNFVFTRSGPGNKKYTFTDQSSVDDPDACPITAWLWTFDDGIHSNAQHPIYTYQTGGTHTATLVVTNAGGTASAGPK